MDPRPLLLEKLQKHPTLAYSSAPGVVRIEAPNSTGFAVELHDDRDEWTVFLGEAGFHEAFASGEEVLNFIAWCFSGSARLRELWRGGLPEKAVLEAEENGAWRPISETGHFFVPFWRKRREVILQNPSLLGV